MSFTQQEEELLDVLREAGPSTGVQLRERLNWSTTRLHPLLAGLEEIKAVRRWTSSVYPHDTFYDIVK